MSAVARTLVLTGEATVEATPAPTVARAVAPTIARTTAPTIAHALCALACLPLLSCGSLGVGGLGGDAASVAQVERFEIISRAPAFGGLAFDDAGDYETIVAVAHMKINPRAAANRGIVDLDKASTQGGWVRYDTDVVIVRPRDAAKASGVLLLDVPDHGAKLFQHMANEGSSALDAAGAGNGFTMRRGHTLVWIGWQGDIALARDGASVGAAFPRIDATGPSIAEAVFDDAQPTSTIALAYPAATQDAARASLSVRATPSSPPTTLPADAWRYSGARAIELTRARGFDMGAIYQFHYEARDPAVMGLGFAALRDVTSFLKSGAADGAWTGQSAGRPAARRHDRGRRGAGGPRAARLDLAGLQRRPARRQSVRRRHAAGRRRRQKLRQRALRAAGPRVDRAPRPSDRGRPVPVQLRRDNGPGQRPHRRHLRQLPAHGHLPEADARRQQRRILASARLTDRHRWRRPRRRAAARRARLPDGVDPARARGRAHGGHLRLPEQHGAAGADGARAARPPDRLDARRRRAAAQPLSAPGRRHADGAEPRRGRLPRSARARRRLSASDQHAGAGRLRRAAAARGRHAPVRVAGADGRCRRPRHRRRAPARHRRAAGHLRGLELAPQRLRRGPVVRREWLVGAAGGDAARGRSRPALSQRYAHRLDYAKAVALAARALRDDGLLLDEDVTRFIERAKIEQRVKP